MYSIRILFKNKPSSNCILCYPRNHEKLNLITFFSGGGSTSLNLLKRQMVVAWISCLR